MQPSILHFSKKLGSFEWHSKLCLSNSFQSNDQKLQCEQAKDTVKFAPKLVLAEVLADNSIAYYEVGFVSK